MFKYNQPFEIKQKIVLTTGAYFEANQLSLDFFKEVLKDTVVNTTWKPRKSGTIVNSISNIVILTTDDLQIL
jgi:hypothetical protein